MNPGEVWPPEEGTIEEEREVEAPGPRGEDAEGEDPSADLPPEFLDMVAGSSLLPALCSYLRNDSGIYRTLQFVPLLHFFTHPGETNALIT